MRVEGNRTLLGMAADTAKEEGVVGISLAQKELGNPVRTTTSTTISSVKTTMKQLVLRTIGIIY